MLVLQPDGPFALCVPGGSDLPSRLVGFAARRLAKLPNASTYIDAGASDWTSVEEALEILRPAGIEHVRGFALNSTHYASTGDEIRYGAEVVAALDELGIPGKHFVVNTAANGRPFNGYDYDGPNFDNAETCTSKTDTSCVTLGIPPTADVANPAWGLSDEENALAAAYADGFVWVGRPWLYMQNDPFVMRRALAVARTTPF
jgi:endoglucanase